MVGVDNYREFGIVIGVMILLWDENLFFKLYVIFKIMFYY